MGYFEILFAVRDAFQISHDYLRTDIHARIHSSNPVRTIDNEQKGRLAGIPKQEAQARMCANNIRYVCAALLGSTKSRIGL